MRPGAVLLRVRPALTLALARVAGAGLAVTLLVPVPPVTAAGARFAVVLPPPPGTTTLVSQRRGGGTSGNERSLEPSISASGRYVAFSSAASDLVRGDTNRATEVFVLDRRTGAIQRAPIPGARAVPQGGEATEPAISADGRVVAFTYRPPPSFAVVTGVHVVAWDRRTGKVEVVSRRRGGGTAMDSRQPSLSSDGRYVAYTSSDPGIRPENETPACEFNCPEEDDVFRYDRRTGTTVLLSVNPDGRPIAGNATDPAISGDGKLVAFLSDGGRSVVPSNGGPGTQVYLRDVAGRTTGRISTAPDGRAANGAAAAPAISANGRYVAYASAATNLVDGPGAGSAGLFRTDLRDGRTIMVSLTPDGTAAGGQSAQPSITADGSVVAFASTATDLVSSLARTGPTARLATIVPAGRSEAYLRNVDSGETVLVSVATNGSPGGPASGTPSVNGNGRFVAFASSAAGLVRNDRNDRPDVFLRDLPPVPRLEPATLDLGAGAVGMESLPGAATLSNAGWSPLTVTGASITGSARKDFRIVADGCRERVLRRGEACTVSVTFRPRTKGGRAATLEIADDFTGSPRTTRLTGRASKATLELDPPIGPPGVVVDAVGADFPPGAQVALSWSEGITPILDPVVAGADGRFRVPVIVFHNDVVGERDLVAEPAVGSGFPSVTAPMLVTMPTSMPPGFAALFRFVDLPFVLVMRG